MTPGDAEAEAEAEAEADLGPRPGLAWNPIFGAMFVTATGLAMIIPNVVSIVGLMSLGAALGASAERRLQVRRTRTQAGGSSNCRLSLSPSWLLAERNIRETCGHLEMTQRQARDDCHCMKPRRALLTAASVLALANCGSTSSPAAEPTPAAPTQPPAASARTGTAALSFSAPLLGGGTFEGSSVAGTPTAFWFWAPT